MKDRLTELTRLGKERKNPKEPMDRLSADACAASKAGMSYGQYKALHPHTPDPQETVDRPKKEIKGYQVERTCARCGVVFLATKSNQKYCCAYCQKAQNDKRHREYARKYREEKKNGTE